jgi:hypothetical protein
MTRKDRQFLILTRDEAGKINVVRCEVPSTPQTLAIRLRKGQQVVVEIEPDNTKSKKAKP